MSQKGLLLANLGTPDAPHRKAVGRFLAEFLADPRVVDLPRWLWLPLLRLIIVPLRSPRSARAYQKIWMEEGSPLLVLTRSLARNLQRALGSDWVVAEGMRYGKPSIVQALKDLQDQGIDDLTVLPLYPQYSKTTTASTEDALQAGLGTLNWQPKLRFIQDYHASPDWVAAVAAGIRQFQVQHGKPDILLFSLHGIPQRYVEQGDPYQEQCETGVQAIVHALDLAPEQWQLTFQSRVGREPWLQPYTDVTLRELAGRGVGRVQVVCPGFAVDCLETLEEIAMQNRELFLEAGGKELEYIPALNDTQPHVDVLRQLVLDAFGRSQQVP